MLTLKECARPGRYSQFGEDGMIATLIDELELKEPAISVEIGAGDGKHLSNTAAFWRDGDWHGILVEANEEHRAALEEARTSWSCQVFLEMATPENVSAFVPREAALLSIDVDGDDYYLWEAIEAEPEIVVIEFNPSIPHWIDIVGDLGSGYGASPAALVRLARSKGYWTVGATHCNLIFVRSQKVAARFDARLERIIGMEALTFLTTDYVGHPYIFGGLPFGLNLEHGIREL